jgi:hypothetical protein
MSQPCSKSLHPDGSYTVPPEQLDPLHPHPHHHLPLHCLVALPLLLLLLLPLQKRAKKLLLVSL